MAIIEMHIDSNALKMNTCVNVIVPDTGDIGEKGLINRKVLWLLHGLSDDASAWGRFSRIEEYARKNKLVVIMPSAGRSMYCDNCLGQNFFTHVAYELPDYFSKLLGISRKRENNFIAGLSMGGMGAMKTALTYPENYFAAGSFSGLLDLSICTFFNDSRLNIEFPFMLDIADNAAASLLNPAALLDAERDSSMLLYASCGKQDSLRSMTESFVKKAEAMELKIHSDYPNGKHEWSLWDKQVEKFINLALNNESY